MDLPLVYIADPWVAHEPSIGLVQVCMPGPWVTLGSHGRTALGHGSPIWVTHRLHMDHPRVFCLYICMIHGSPTDHSWASDVFTVLVRGSRIGHVEPHGWHMSDASAATSQHCKRMGGPWPTHGQHCIPWEIHGLPMGYPRTSPLCPWKSYG